MIETVLGGGDAAAYNSIAEPDRIRIEKLETEVCESGERSFEFTAPPLSFCVIRAAVKIERPGSAYMEKEHNKII